MKELSFDSKCFYIDGKPVYFNCGEFHYFRVPKKDWEKRMILLKEAGGNALATYIPWCIHEPEEGKFVFDQGDGVTDLNDFLKCAKKVGLYVIARPGPYSYSEIVRCGLPFWIADNYPEAMAESRSGNKLGSNSVSYLHPVFLKKVKAWYNKVCPMLKKHTLKNGGPVAMIQLDNEVGGIHIWFGDRDFNRETMGFGKKNGLYPAWLKNKYGTVAAANEAYGTKRKTFLEFGPQEELSGDGSHYRWDQDYIEFYNWTITEYLFKLKELVEANGVDCLYCHNAANAWMVYIFRNAKQRFGEKILIGVDHYYMLCQTWGRQNPTPDFQISCFTSAEMLRLMGNPPCVLEAQYGSVSEWPPTKPEDTEAFLTCQLASGVRGHNGYVFTGGPNPDADHFGATCRVYDYDAPIGPNGEIRRHYHAVKRFGLFAQAHPEFANDKTDADVRVAMPWRILSGLYGKPHNNSPETGNFAECFNKGLMLSLFASGLQPEFIDGGKDDWTKDFSTPVYVPCDGVMPASEQTRYVKFIKAGGRVVFSPVLPFLDENLHQCSILADAFGAAAGEELNVPDIRFDFGSGEFSTLCSGHAYTCARIPENAEIFGFELTSRTPAAWCLKAGKGMLGWNGIITIVQRREHNYWVKKTFDMLNGETRWISDNDWVTVFRRKTEKGPRIFLANLGTSREAVNAKYRETSDSPWITLPEVKLDAMEVKMISL